MRMARTGEQMAESDLSVRKAEAAGMARRFPEFALTKWYMDVVDEHQTVYIGYWLSLAWRKLKLRGHHQLLRTARDGVKHHGAFGALPAPMQGGDARIRWHAGDATALWTAAAAPIEAMLHQSALGEIRWRCLMPKAHGRVELPQRSITGWGYVECIEMTLPVWNLPFQHLYWGRCHTANHCLVWIQWSGASSQTLAWHDGRCLTDLVIADDAIRTSEWRLTIDRRLLLRDGTLLSSLFGPLGHVPRLLPRSVLLAHERKWVGQGRLHVQGGSEPATILYEEVAW
jgi:hypothetical protein